jgi:rubrerythrin
VIAREWNTGFWMRVAIGLAWRRDAQIAERLEAFSATEAGSALDMLKAAELVPDRRLRRLFFRHATDEARHAQLFHAAALELAPMRTRGREGYGLIHATRQNLFARYGLTRFVAFVYLAERRAARQFVVLRDRLAHRPELARLFERILRDERFHVAYSEHLLEQWSRAGRRNEIRLALFRVRVDRAWGAWRRSGRRVGDLLAKSLLLALYVLVVPWFALLARWRDRPQTGWCLPPLPPRSLDDARRQG